MRRCFVDIAFFFISIVSFLGLFIFNIRGRRLYKLFFHLSGDVTWDVAFLAYLFLCEFIICCLFKSAAARKALETAHNFILKGAINWCKDTWLSPYTLTSYEPPAAVNLGRSLNIGLVVFKGGQSDEAIFRFYLVSSVWNEKK